jgi:hypothetical protein
VIEAPAPAPAERGARERTAPTAPHPADRARHLHSAPRLRDALLPIAVGLVATNRLALAPPSMPDNQIDAGWQLALNHAALNGSVFGRDVVHNFGPLGFLHLPMFDPALYGWCVLFGVALALVVTADVVGLARRAGIPTMPAALWGIALVLIAAPDPDGRFYLLCILAAWIGIDGHDRPSPSLVAANTMVLAVVSLAKFSHAVSITALVVLMSLRNGPLPAVVFAATVSALWAAAGQPLDAVPAFLRGSMEVATGYAESLVEDGPVGEIVTYVVSAAALLGLLAMRAAHARSVWRWLALGYNALLLALIFKHAFTLHLYHSLTAVMGLGVASVAAAGACWEWRRTSPAAALVVVALGAIVVIATSRHAVHYWPLVSPRSLLDQTVGYLPRIAGATNGWSTERATWTAARRRLADDHPLPRSATGSIDVLGWQTALPLVGALPWRPKPVFQQYVAATPALAALNARHVAASGADTLIADVTTVSQRSPMLDLGPTLLEVIRHYRVAEEPGEFLVLRRREAPRPVSLEPLATQRLSLGQRLDVPPSDGPVWVRIEVGSTIVGRIRGLVLKRPKLFLELELADGSTRRFTIFPGMARSGFLLSPVVVSANGLGAVLTGDAGVTGAWVVRALTVREAVPSGSYAEPVDVTLAALRFAPDEQPPRAADPSVPLSLAAVNAVLNARLRSADDGLVADRISPGAVIMLPYVAGSSAEASRSVELDVDVTHAQELRVMTRRAGEPFGFDRAVTFQLSPGRRSLPIALPVSTVPVQVRIDPAVGGGPLRILAARQVGVATTAPAPGLARIRDVARGLPGWFLPFRSRALATGPARGDMWFFQPVGGVPPAGPVDEFRFDGMQPFAGFVPRPLPNGVALEFPDTGGAMLLATVPPGQRTGRVLEVRLVATAPVAVRFWWKARPEARWNIARSLGVFVDADPTIVRVPLPGHQRPLEVRLDVDPGAAGTLEVMDARLLAAVDDPPAGAARPDH